MRPRIRTIKPDAALDEGLWELGEETGLPVFQAFTMLWCCADREGRFEWRPRALKALCLPYWDGDFADVLDALERGRFVVAYEVDGKRYGYVRTFGTHQRINQREAQSVLPAPPETDAGAENPPDDDGGKQSTCTHVHARGEGKGREGKGGGRERAGAREAPTPHGLKTAQKFQHTFCGPPPDDAPLDENTRLLARSLSLSAFSEWEALRDHARSKALVSADWGAELRSWMRRSGRFAEERRERQAARSPPGRREHDRGKAEGGYTVDQLFKKTGEKARC